MIGSNMNTPKISIVIPVYNVEKYLDKCVQSLISQTLSEIEIILVDDGSLDGCSEMCDEYAKKDSRIKVIHKKNGGVSSARNAGLKVVSGEYYMFDDSDDWLDLETCEVAYRYIKQHQADCLMFSYMKEFASHSTINHIFEQDFFIWEGHEVEQNFHRRLFGPVDGELARPQDLDLLVAPWMQLFRTEKFVEIPFFDIREVGTFEDGLYQMVLYRGCQRFVYIDRPFYHYLKTNESSITTRYKADLFEKWQQLFDVIQGYIDQWNLHEEYVAAFNNRIALSLLGIGLNQTNSDDNLIRGSNHLKRILNTERYSVALSQLDTSYMPVSWKVFFFLAKHKFTIPLFVMLKIIEYVRTHK